MLRSWKLLVVIGAVLVGLAGVGFLFAPYVPAAHFACVGLMAICMGLLERANAES